MDCSHIESRHPKADFDVDKVRDIVMETMKGKDIQSSNAEIISKSTVAIPSCSEKQITESNESKITKSDDSSRKSSVMGPDTSKPLKKKAKLMRMERKAQKLALTTEKLSANVAKKEPKNVPKGLEVLLNEVQSNSRHKLEVVLLVE